MGDKIPNTIAELEWLWKESDCEAEKGKPKPKVKTNPFFDKPDDEPKPEVKIIQSKMNPEYRRKGDLIVAFYPDTEEYQIVGHALRLPNGTSWPQNTKIPVRLTKDYGEHRKGTRVIAILLPNNQVFLFTPQGKVIMGNAIYKADFEFI